MNVTAADVPERSRASSPDENPRDCRRETHNQSLWTQLYEGTAQMSRGNWARRSGGLRAARGTLSSPMTLGAGRFLRSWPVPLYCGPEVGRPQSGVAPRSKRWPGTSGRLSTSLAASRPVHFSALNGSLLNSKPEFQNFYLTVRPVGGIIQVYRSSCGCPPSSFFPSVGQSHKPYKLRSTFLVGGVEGVLHGRQAIPPGVGTTWLWSVDSQKCQFCHPACEAGRRLT